MTVHQLQENNVEQSLLQSTAYIDLTKAFDWVKSQVTSMCWSHCMTPCQPFSTIYHRSWSKEECPIASTLFATFNAAKLHLDGRVATGNSNPLDAWWQAEFQITVLDLQVHFRLEVILFPFCSLSMCRCSTHLLPAFALFASILLTHLIDIGSWLVWY